MAKPRKQTFASLEEYLRAARAFEGKSQGQIAAELGISEPYLSELKHGKARPGWDLARKISTHCNIPIEAFISAREEAVS
jgi:transcriptional regulator with XRE-family HTH domain